MRLEDDPSIGACACSYCGQPAGEPCRIVNSYAYANDRKWTRSHGARIRAAIKELYKSARHAEEDGADDGGMSFVIAAGRLSAEIKNRRMKNR